MGSAGPQLPESFTLNTGATIPAIGFGTWQAAPNEVERAVEIALRNGYTHIDCAAIYRNEAEVGAGIKNSGVKREDIFITTKLWNTRHEPEEVEGALDESLRDLGVDYVDLYLMHWPTAFASGNKFFPLSSSGIFQLSSTPFTKTYAAMEKLLQTGKVKAIGVSNFTQANLEILLQSCTVVPAVNQIEAHPYIQQPSLFSFCASKGILIEAYSPLGNNQTNSPKTMDDECIHSVAKELGMDPAQICVSWGVQRGTVVLPKSVTEKRIVSNRNVQSLPKEVFEKVNGLERHKRFNVPSYRWGHDIFGEISEDGVKKTAEEMGKENLGKFKI